MVARPPQVTHQRTTPTAVPIRMEMVGQTTKIRSQMIKPSGPITIPMATETIGTMVHGTLLATLRGPASG